MNGLHSTSRRLAMLSVAVSLLAGCGDNTALDRQGMAAALAKTIAAEEDHVTVAELSDWLIKDQRDYELVDIREKTEFDTGHIQGAQHIPLAGLLADNALAALPQGRKVVVYSNGTAHAAQAAVLLRLVERDAYALLGGYNYWQAYLNDPQSAGVDEMDPAERAAYQAVACYFEGEYMAAAGLIPKVAAVSTSLDTPTPATAADPLGLGLELGLGSDEARAGVAPEPAAEPATDSLGLGLDLGLGSDEVRSLKQNQPPKAEGSARKLLIKAEC